MDFNILDERTWPLDNPDEVSIGRAFQVVGQQRYGDEWPEIAGSALVPLVAPLPPLEKANTVDRLRAWSLLPEGREKTPPTITTTRGSSIFFTAHNWQRAEEVLAPRIAAQDKVAACFSAIRSAIRDACLSGSLEARAQIYNGQSLVIKSHIWKTQRFIRWFSTGRSSMLEVSDQPFSSDEPTLWVYFNRAQLDRSFPPVARADDSPPRSLKAYSAKEVDDWLAAYWAKFDGSTLHTFSDGKERAAPRFKLDFTPAMNEAFPNISTRIIRESWDDRPVGGRRHR